ncbi:RDD family protein [Tropicibacter naphthalenivorans]|uniref:RDD family protein n=1 Tax=Tropicibacter naphthalenivorans TaxID=441103 RepID=A0A0P1G7E0_9RHOB|nr:RDD family protein [Tropicibacter naphthalenivorans]CUH77572.1 RDD family protein [Tropicibacter naphthalenivorans]SMC56334.1 RDD family protein [Tropicibacter naphthalenivorans]
MYSEPLSHLPDPVHQAEFYESVTIKRGLAWVIDALFIGILATAVSLVTIVGVFFWPVFFLVVGFLYRWMTLASGSATWGMRIMAIEFRDAYGQRLDGGQALLHTLGYTISMSMVLVQVVSVILMFTTERGQGLTDLVLGTVALNRRA